MPRMNFNKMRIFLKLKITLFLCILSIICELSLSAPSFYEEEIKPEELARVQAKLKDIRYLILDRSKKDWVSISRDDPLPEGLWVAGGESKLIIHGYTFKDWQTVEQKIGLANRIFFYSDYLMINLAYGEHNTSSNIMIVDWTALSTEPLHKYFQAAKTTRLVGQDVAEFLVRLFAEEYITDWDRVHLIGFSLGGHTAGVVGANVIELTGNKVGRITGLDPAGPGFDNDGEMPKNLNWFLDKSDGKFVDIIHCNMRLPSKPYFGYYGSCVEAGHVDFYPNGGETQKLCSRADDLSVTPCSHMKCPEYMAKSINENLVACPCEDWALFENGKCDCSVENGGVLMGDPCKSGASGKYFIQMK